VSGNQDPVTYDIAGDFHCCIDCAQRCSCEQCVTHRYFRKESYEANVELLRDAKLHTSKVLEGLKGDALKDTLRYLVKECAAKNQTSKNY
jgi:hypothetical protein